jgi:hypothetical protein
MKNSDAPAMFSWHGKKPLLYIVVAIAINWNGILEAQQLARVRPSGPAHTLRAIRKGDYVELRWKQALESGGRHLTLARVCRSVSSTVSEPPASATICQAVGKVALRGTTAPLTNAVYGKPAAEIGMRFTDRLPKDLQQSESLQFAVYDVEVLDDHGLSAGRSNRALVLLTPTPAVKALHSDLDSRGVYLIWEDDIENHPQGVKFDYLVSRREGRSGHRIDVPYLRAVVHLRDGDRWTGVDTSLEWGKTYTYWITPIARVYSPEGRLLAEMEAEESAPLEVNVQNVFPPAVPERLLALVGHSSGKRFVDLVWAPNVDRDLAGYNVYRREAGAEMTRIHRGPISLLSFQDADVASGHTYFYCLSAVGANGNESPKSNEVTVIIP